MFVFVIAIRFDVFVIIPATFDLFIFYFLIFNCYANCLICSPNNFQKIHSFDWLFNKFCLPLFVLLKQFDAFFSKTVNICWRNSCQIIAPIRFELNSFNFHIISRFRCSFVLFSFVSFCFRSITQGEYFYFRFCLFLSPFISFVHLWFFS